MRTRPACLPFEFFLLERDQWLSPERVREIQWHRFKRALAHAYARSPFYRERMRGAGIAPDDIEDPRDLPKIPVTRREDLRDPERLLARGFAAHRAQRSTTSGSTGRRTTTYFDRPAWLQGKILLKLRARRACGLRPWDRVAIFTAEKPENGLLSRAILRQRKFSALEPLERQIPALERYNPTALYGFPSLLSLLAERGARIAPARIFTSSEMLDGATRRRIAAAFGADVFDVYGSTEFKEVAWECPERAGYHVNADWLLVEFLRDGKPVSDGDGSIVVSSLYNRGMPLLRYEIGDTGRPLEGACPCGRGLPLMAPARGRLVDHLTLPDGTRVSPYVVTCAVEPIDGMRQYQIRQRRRDLVTVTVVPGRGFGEGTRRAIAAALARALPATAVEVVAAERIAHEPSGKYRIVISDVAERRPAPPRPEERPWTKDSY